MSTRCGQVVAEQNAVRNLVKNKRLRDTLGAPEPRRRQGQSGVSFVNREKSTSHNQKSSYNYYHDTCLPSFMGSELVFSAHVEAADGKTEFKNAFFVKN